MVAPSKAVHSASSQKHPAHAATEKSSTRKKKRQHAAEDTDMVVNVPSDKDNTANGTDTETAEEEPHAELG
jgi:hypothetical protein